MFTDKVSMRGQTVIYNGVQFGGLEDLFHMSPPEYSLSTQNVYDDTGRGVKYQMFRLRLTTVLVGDGQTDSDSKIKTLREKLLAPRQELQVNTGAGVGKITVDYQNGPKPVTFQLTPLAGNTSWSLLWEIEFAAYQCDPNVGANPSWESFAFLATWNYDEAGIATRSISGHWTIPAPQRSGNVQVGEPARVTADAKRDVLQIEVPWGFRRTGSSYTESTDKKRVDFAVTDVQFGDDYPYPHGCIHASGRRHVTATGQAMVQGAMTLNMSLTTAPGYHRSHGAIAFFQQAMAMQARWTANQLARNAKSTILPQNITVSPGLFDDARQTDYSITWLITGCIMDLLLSQEMWRPVEGTSYQQWRNSIHSNSPNQNKRSWHQRGWSNLGTVPGDDVIVSTCTNNAPIRIGRSNALTTNTQAGRIQPFAAPDIPPDYSWLGYDVQVSVKHTEFVRTHRAAVAHKPKTDDDNVKPGYLLGGISPTDERQTRDEWVGQPVQEVLLQFKGLRVQHKPQPPTLISVGGKEVRPKELVHTGTQLIGSAMDKPIYAMRFAKSYTVSDKGIIAAMDKTHVNKSLCTLIDPDKSEYRL